MDATPQAPKAADDDNLFNLGGTQVLGGKTLMDLTSPMAPPSSINIKSELERLSSTQIFNKSTSAAFCHPVVNNGGFFTMNSSAAH
jgi:hypothetical protein